MSVRSQYINNNDKELIFNVLKYFNPDNSDLLTISVTGANAITAAHKLSREEKFELSQKPNNAKEIEIIISKNYDKTYNIEISIWYKDWNVDENFLVNDDVSLREVASWIGNWLKQFPNSKIEYDSAHGVSFFGHESTPKRKSGLRQLENSVRKMW